jgi:4-hydroxybenzoate polyprenyltransferase
VKIRDAVVSLRPTQWTKNLFVAAALIFAKKIFDVPSVLRTLAAFGIFCLLAGAHYIVNDLLDVEEDRVHPRKSRRPIAAGRVGRAEAVTLAAVLAALSLVLADILSPAFFGAAAAYVVLQLAYSYKLKHVVILDIFLVASGFVLRVIAGGLVIAVPISPWLLLCTMLLALFLAISKRRHELQLLAGDASRHRPILGEYSFGLLDQMISIVTACTVIAYCLYTVSDETVRKFGTDRLIYTTPFVLYGIFRYLYLIYQKDQGGSPEELILKDKPLLASIVLWIASAVAIIYYHL